MNVLTIRKFWHWLLLGAVSLVLVPCLPAQDLQLCTDVNSTTGYKVLLDDIRFNSGATDAQDKQLMDLLKFQLKNRFEDLGDSPDARYKLIRCSGRIPDGEASFPPMIVDGLVNRDVVLEIWGEVFPSSAGKHRVFLNYAMLPLPANTSARFLQRQYQPKVGSSADDIVDWLANLNELTAYAMVARAVRSLATGGPSAYDGAKADLETASSSLRTAFGDSPSATQKQLLAFLSERKCAILHDARNNISYHGPLRQLPDSIVERECPAGGGQ